MASDGPDTIRVRCKVRGAPSFLAGVAFGASSVLLNLYPKTGYLEFRDGRLEVSVPDNLGVDVAVFKTEIAALARLIVQKDTSKGYHVASKIDAAIPLGVLGSIIMVGLYVFVLNDLLFGVRGEDLAGHILVIWPASFLFIAGIILLSGWIKPNPFLILRLDFRNGGIFSVRIRSEELQSVERACSQQNLYVERDERYGHI